MKGSLKRGNTIRVLKSQPVNGQSGQLKLPQEQLDKALLDAFDLMQRCLLDTTFIVLGDAAKCIKERRGLDCNKLEFGIEKRYLTPEVMSTLKEWVKGGQFVDNGFSYVFEGVPVRFKYITRRYRFFKNLDSQIYMPEWYKIANPFKNYWKARFLIT